VNYLRPRILRTAIALLCMYVGIVCGNLLSGYMRGVYTNLLDPFGAIVAITYGAAFSPGPNIVVLVTILFAGFYAATTRLPLWACIAIFISYVLLTFLIPWSWEVR
jgi:hypothetical protein